MARLIYAALATLCAGQASTQDPYAVAPQAYHKQFENGHVKVTRVHYAPHEILAEHAHPARPSVYIYLKDGGPVLFKHQHGDSGDYAATRAATKAGSYRLALGRSETHVVENRSDLPSDFLQVELKSTVDPKAFIGRRFPDEAADRSRSSSKVEYEEPGLRIHRLRCIGGDPCRELQFSHPTLLVALQSGATYWREPEGEIESDAISKAVGDYLAIEFRALVTSASARHDSQFSADRK